jgi:ribosomal protein S18 acetylase RimI-like enzyme
MPRVKTLARADVDDVAGAFARAFEGDPVFVWAFPDERTSLRRMIAMNKAMIPPMFKVPFMELYTTDDHAGLAIWAGPEQWEAPTRAMLPAVPRLLRAMGVGSAKKFVALMGALKKVHPHEPHWYLAGLGTDPSKQGTGVGSALVRHVLGRCDAEKLPAYLETQKPENVPYYEKFGFRVTGEIDIPLGGPHMWLMWRDPS